MPKRLAELKVTRNRLYEQVFQQLERMILTRQLQLGDRLPSEREIAEQLNVSRTVVREAIKALEQRGLIRVLTGDGTYVTQAKPDIVSRSLGVLIQQSGPSLNHLSEVRRILELDIAALAAERLRPQDAAAMEEALKQMEEAVRSADRDPEARERFAEADLAFHSALVEAAQNPLLSILLAPITDRLLEFRRRASSVPGAMQDALHYHGCVLEIVKAHDPLAAREMMREHLLKAEQWARLASAER